MTDLEKFLALEEENRWLMHPGERLVLVGLLTILKPKRVLEIGHRHGGCTECLCRFSGEVHSVDLDPRVIESCKRWPNARGIHADSQKAMRDLAAAGQRFDLVLVDADHRFASARDDLLAAARLADIIVVHDTFHPECRAGYEEALRQLNAYADLDLADGHIMWGGIWGGLGVVVTSLPRATELRLTPRVSNAGVLEHQQRVMHERNYRVSHAWRLLRAFRSGVLALFPFVGVKPKTPS